MLAKDASVLTKAGTMSTALATAIMGLQNATKMIKFAVAAFLMMMARLAKHPSSHCRNVLGTKIMKGTTLWMGDIHTDEHGKNATPPDLGGKDLTGNKKGRKIISGGKTISAGSGGTVRIDRQTKVSTACTIYTSI